MSDTRSRKRASAEKQTDQPVEDGFLCEVNAVIVEQKLGRARADILSRQLLRNGGRRHNHLQSDTTHILIDNSLTYSKTLDLLKATAISPDVLVVRADWLSSCLTNGRVVDHKPFEAVRTNGIHEKMENLQDDAGTCPGFVSDKEVSSTDTSPVKSQSELSSTNATPEKREGHYGWRQNPRKKLIDMLDDDSDYIDSGSDSDELSEIVAVGDSVVKSEDVTTSAPSRKKLRGTWVCAQPSTLQLENLNKHITDKLEVLAKMYKSTKDQWRSMMYTKAITALKNHPKEVTSYEEALEIPFVGKRLAEKIAEIASSGHLRRLDHLDPDLEAIECFTNVWGAGPTTARQWLNQGLRTLEDLKERGNLNRQQLVGLKHYHDFMERIPRDEVTAIREEVRRAALFLVPGLEIEVCGSFRRGKETCGDVDVLVSHPDGCGHKGLFKPLIQKLTAEGKVSLIQKIRNK
jgi:DNA polymerase lambda